MSAEPQRKASLLTVLAKIGVIAAAILGFAGLAVGVLFPKNHAAVMWASRSLDVLIQAIFVGIPVMLVVASIVQFIIVRIRAVVLARRTHEGDIQPNEGF